MTFPRRSGVILHPTSLPGRFGIGDLGEHAFRFVDFLADAGQTYWQILPLSPTGFGDSPYQGLSALAGNPLLISPDLLVQAGHLDAADLENTPSFPDDRVDFGTVIQFKNALLDRAFAHFVARASNLQRASFAEFCHTHASWLDDFALFMAIKTARQGQPWYEWDRELMTRKEDALIRARETLATEIANVKYRQWQFFEQWRAVKQSANARGIHLIGDIPIFVARDSADVWANAHLFEFDENLQPTVVSGVPPDYFSTTGQLWGHPLYRWDLMEQENFAWWLARFRLALTQADVIRIDHFRGFYNYWRVPAGETTAINGKWKRAPGAKLFRALQVALGDIAIIAEDLGEYDDKSRAGVDALQNTFGIPGMKILQFAFSDEPNNPFLPHHLSRDAVVYTGTHDNDTTVGWYRAADEKTRDYVRRYVARDGADVAWDLIRLAWASVAHTAMTTAQDLLSLDNKARFNMPSTSGAPNWCWRVLPGALDANLAARLRELTWVYGRLAEKPAKDQDLSSSD